MKPVAEMSLQELAAFVCSHLQAHDIPVVLVGGSCVSIYSDNRYQTADLDFVERYHTRRAALRQALAGIGFVEENRYFVHPDTAWFLEFPTGPLAVGDQPVQELNEVATDTGVLVLLTPTDCIKDRLAAWFHWRRWRAEPPAAAFHLVQRLASFRQLISTLLGQDVLQRPLTAGRLRLELMAQGAQLGLAEAGGAAQLAQGGGDVGKVSH